MQNLYPLNQNDVEAVAKNRVAKQELKSTNKWMWAMIIGIVLGGIVAYKVHVMGGYGVMILSLVSFLYYNSTLTKKQNVVKYQLLKEWNEKNKEVK